MSTFQPVFIGVSPAGVEWIAYRPENVCRMRERFAILTAKHAATQATKPITKTTKVPERSRVTLFYVVGDETEQRQVTISVPAGLSAVETSDMACERLYNRHRRTVTILDEELELL